MTRTEDRVIDLWPGQWQSPERVELIRSYPLGFRFASLSDWHIGPLFLKHEHATVGGINNLRTLSIGLPTWALPLVGGALAWSPIRAVLTLRSRRRRGLCLTCGYDMKGLEVCPECGTAGGSAGA